LDSLYFFFLSCLKLHLLDLYLGLDTGTVSTGIGGIRLDPAFISLPLILFEQHYFHPVVCCIVKSNTVRKSVKKFSSSSSPFLAALKWGEGEARERGVLVAEVGQL
jgi:hypothetical protein